MNKINYVWGVFVLIFALSGCVSRKKYDALAAQKAQLDKDKAQCETNFAGLTKDKQDLDKRFSDLNQVLAKLKDDTATAGSLYRKNKSLLNDLFSKYDRLDKSYNQLLSNSAQEAGALSRDLAKRERELKDAEQNLAASKAEVEKSRAQINRLADDLKKREDRVAELEKVLADKEKAVKDLRAKVSNALLSFKEKDLTVNVKNGKVYVSLSEQLLFKSGSYAVDPKGLEAIKKLAGVLKDNADIGVLVEGHTDDVELRAGTACMVDNWDLSVLRATAIVRTLTQEGVNGAILTAGGRSKYIPLAEGRTPEVRQRNRRTEIILTPKLDELFQILE